MTFGFLFLLSGLTAWSATIILWFIYVSFLGFDKPVLASTPKTTRSTQLNDQKLLIAELQDFDLSEIQQDALCDFNIRYISICQLRIRRAGAKTDVGRAD